MGLNTLSKVALSAALVVSPLVACGGGPSSQSEHVQQAKQADGTGTPLWTTQYNPSDRTKQLTVYAADVDGAGNTYVGAASFLQGPGSVYVFDQNGGLSASYSAFTGQHTTIAAMRVNGTGFVITGNTDWDTQYGFRPYGHIRRYDASGNLLFAIDMPRPNIGAPEGSYGAADLCDDGTLVVASSRNPGGNALEAYDDGGNQLWSVPQAGGIGKIRCLGDGVILATGGGATLQQFESDGTNDWTFTAPDPLGLGLSFDIDGSGAPYVGSATKSGQPVVYALDTSGNLQWSWYSAGSSDTFAGIAVSDVVDVTGSVTNSTDTSGNQLWSASASGASVGIDDADDAFVCGTGSSTLLGPDGSTQWSYAQSMAKVVRADVTNAVARCIGGTNNGISIVAFQVQ